MLAKYNLTKYIIHYGIHSEIKSQIIQSGDSWLIIMKGLHGPNWTPKQIFDAVKLIKVSQLQASEDRKSQVSLNNSRTRKRVKTENRTKFKLPEFCERLATQRKNPALPEA